MPRYRADGPSVLMIDRKAWEIPTGLIGQGRMACMWVLMVSTGNIAMCSTEPAIEPATMSCQNRSPWGWDGTMTAGWKSGGWGIGRRSLDDVVAIVELGFRDQFSNLEIGELKSPTRGRGRRVN